MAPPSPPLINTALWVVVWSIGACALIALAAIAWVLFAHHRRNLRERRRARREATWDTLLMDILWGKCPESELLNTLTPADHGAFLSVMARYSHQVKGREHETLLALARPFLPLALADLRARTPEHRARAVDVLADLTSGEHDGVLARALHDRSPIVAMAALRALTRHGATDYAEHVVRSLARFEHWNRRYLAQLLARLGAPSASLFRRALTDSARPAAARAIAAEALAALHDLASAPAAADALRSTDDTELQIAVLRLIESIGGEDELPVVRTFVESPDAGVRVHALRALSVLGTGDDVETIRHMVDDESSWVTLTAARGLLRLNRRDLLEQRATSVDRRSTVALEVLETPPS